MMKFKRLITSAMLLISALFAGCKPAEPRWGKEFNNERKKLGIPIIPDNWWPNPGDNFTTWENPETGEKYKAHIPVHSFKSVHYEGDVLLWESDMYEGASDYMTVDGPRREGLVIDYVYREYTNPDTFELVKPGWYITYTNLRGEDVSLSLEEAKALLEKWKVRFP
jgi:hypothetical protein